MRVRFGSDQHWSHLDEASARLLLRLHNDHSWLTVRSLCFRLGRFHYSAHPTPDSGDAAAPSDAAHGTNRRQSTLLERVIGQLFASRSIETAGLTVQMLDAHGQRAHVRQMAGLVREQLHDERLRMRKRSVVAVDAAMPPPPPQQQPLAVEQYVLDGLKRARQGV